MYGGLDDLGIAVDLLRTDEILGNRNLRMCEGFGGDDVTLLDVSVELICDTDHGRN